MRIQLVHTKAVAGQPGRFTVVLGDPDQSWAGQRDFYYTENSADVTNLTKAEAVVMAQAYIEGASSALDVQRNQNPIGLNRGDMSKALRDLALA